MGMFWWKRPMFYISKVKVESIKLNRLSQVRRCWWCCCRRCGYVIQDSHRIAITRCQTILSFFSFFIFTPYRSCFSNYRSCYCAWKGLCRKKVPAFLEKNMSTNAPKTLPPPINPYNSTAFTHHPIPGMSMEASTWNLYNRYIQIGFSRRKPKIIGYLSNLMQSHWLSFFYITSMDKHSHPKWNVFPNVEKTEAWLWITCWLAWLPSSHTGRCLREVTVTRSHRQTARPRKSGDEPPRCLGRWCIFSIFRGKKQPVFFVK